MCKYIQISSMLWNFVVTVVTKPQKNLLKEQLLIKLMLTRNRLWPASTENKQSLDQKNLKQWRSSKCKYVFEKRLSRDIRFQQKKTD